MTDIVLVATIVAFFVAAALLVRVIDRMIADASEEQAIPGEDGAELESGSIS
jgi:hypothetical protein